MTKSEAKAIQHMSQIAVHELEEALVTGTESPHSVAEVLGGIVAGLDEVRRILAMANAELGDK